MVATAMLDAITEERLITAAREAWDRAYAPYSRFAVGAAVLGLGPEDATATAMTLHAGCNVENASFGLTICAERSAVFQAVASGVRRIVAVAVVTDTVTPTMPCGACRQVLREFGCDLLVIGATVKGVRTRYRLCDLLPDSFGPEHLPAV